MEKTRVALLGCGFIANIHAESYSRFVGDAEVVAVYGHNKTHAEEFAKQHNIPAWYDDVDALLAAEQVDVVDICLPNYLHHEVCLKAAEANKHVICEKPLALTLEQADEMIAACESRNLKLMYAEELCFAPKYERVRALVEAGAVGDVYMLKQGEKHSGPHSRWFYQKETAGGGVMMDMGCHALAWFRWMNKNNPVKSVYASMKTVLHGSITDCDDNTITMVEFENGVTCLLYTSGPDLYRAVDRRQGREGPGENRGYVIHGDVYKRQYARMLRASILGVRRMEYLEAAAEINASPLRIIVRHLLPNSFSPLIVQATMGVGQQILIAAGLSFIGPVSYTHLPSMPLMMRSQFSMK